MIGERLKQIRLAHGLSLDELSVALGGAVTKQALSKYELGKDRPSAIIIMKLAAVLGVKASRFWEEPSVIVKFIAYRKSSGLSAKEQTSIQSQVEILLEERVRLQKSINQFNEVTIPVQKLNINIIEDAEAAALELRKKWNLGDDPIASMVGVLEEHNVHVLEIEADTRFDGISAVVYSPGSSQDHPLAAAVVTRAGIVGDRQRLDLGHELGHLVLRVTEELAESAAFRFAGAFLAPEETLKREIGSRRAHIEFQELLILKKQFGMSVQALLRRFLDLKIIDDLYYKNWCIYIARYGYRKVEPYPLSPERPQWLRRTLLRAYAEGQMTAEEAESMLGERVAKEQSLSVSDRRSVLKLPPEERSRKLMQQAEIMMSFYDEDEEWRDLSVGDIIEY